MVTKTEKDLSEIKKLLKKILKNQEEVKAGEKTVEAEEEAQLAELQELESIEKDIEKEVRGTALGKITSRDFTKALIGAIFGTVGHFAFFYGTKLALDITMFRASMLYLTSFIIAIVFMYFAGFRVIDKKNLRFIPFRVLIIYLTSIAVILFVLSIFGFIGGETSFSEIFKSVSTISILAVLGASAADLLGKEE